MGPARESGDLGEVTLSPVTPGSILRALQDIAIGTGGLKAAVGDQVLSGGRESIRIGADRCLAART